MIYNPAAGKLRRNPDLLPHILEALRQDGRSVLPMPTSGPGHAVLLGKQCVALHAERVYVLGGDGTINEAVNGVAQSGVPLCPLPGGTANCLAVEVGIGTRVLRAAARASTYTAKRIPLGHCRLASGEERYFIAMAGAGFDAKVVREVNPFVKKQFGKVAYWLAGFARFFETLPELIVRSHNAESVVDSPVEATVSFALASRVRNYGGDLEIAKAVRLDEPYFETVLFEGRYAVFYARYLAGVLTNTHHGMSGVHVAKTNHLKLAAANGAPVYLQLDGEQCGELPAELRVVPDALSLLAPWPV